MTPHVTALIKTFERPQCLARLLESMPDWLPKVIVDDSAAPVTEDEANSVTPNCTVIRPGFDVGLSAGRNIGVDAIDTQYTMLLDDDFVFRHEDTPTDVDFMVDWLEYHPQYDLLGFKIQDGTGPKDPHGWDKYWGSLAINNRMVKCTNVSLGEIDDADIVDFCCNGFVARTNCLRHVRWDDDLKLAEHWEFFWRFKKAHLRCARHRLVGINHVQDKPADYRVYRRRANEFFKIAMDKYKLKGIRGIDGKTYYPPAK